MATTGAYNHQNKDNERRKDFSQKKSYASDGTREKREFKSRDQRDQKPRFDKNRDDRPRDDRRDNREDRPRGERRYDDNRQRGDYKPKNDFKRGGFNKDGGYGKGSYQNGFDKDKDEDTPVRRKPVARDNKPKEAQSEKMDVMNRLEKEKKAMKKKQLENRKDSKPVKHQAKPKRSGNVDWTRAYENDSYDDDDLDMYL